MSYPTDPHHGSYGDQGEYSYTGIPNPKVGIWAFIAMEGIFFGALLSTHFFHQYASANPIDTQNLLDFPLASFSTFVLLACSLQMALAVNSMRGGNLKITRWLLLGAILFGILFLGSQVYETLHLVRTKALTMGSDIFGSTYHVLVGTLGAHVIIGVLWLLGWLVFSFTGNMTPDHWIDVEVAAHYWHFTNLVWVVIFLSVHLIRFAP